MLLVCVRLVAGPAGICSQPLVATALGLRNPGNTTERTYFDMTAQATVKVTAGNKYTFYATAYRYLADEAIMSLSNVHLIAAFSAT
jgi:hypothetical protein